MAANTGKYEVVKRFERTTVIKHDEYIAVREGDIKLIIKLLVPNDNVVDDETIQKVHSMRWSGFTLLHRAAENGHTDIVELLLSLGAKIDCQSVWGWYTPLHLAAGNGWKETSLFLLEKGANPEVRTKGKLNVIEYAKKKGYPEIAVDLDKHITKKAQEKAQAERRLRLERARQAKAAKPKEPEEMAVKPIH